MRKPRRQPQRYPVTSELNGVEIKGSYELDGKIITVFYRDQSEATQLGGSASSPETLARIILEQLIRIRSR